MKLNATALHDAANVVRTLTVDAIERAKSGHPGVCLGAAELGVLLYGYILKHCPDDPEWPDRDRFVLSAGHGSMLLYSLLHLSGYDLSLDDIRAFRSLGSRTPGHPEHGLTPGVETTTGPLGQGLANAVGMAIAERMLASAFNRPGHLIVDHFTYALAGDGDLMEGVASEAASVAGHLGLGKLIVFYDSNDVTIDGPTGITFSEDVGLRFKAYGWHVEGCSLYDADRLVELIAAAKAATDRPSLLVLKSVIGKGWPSFAGKSAAHGTAFSAEEARTVKRAIGVPEDQAFHVPESVRLFFEERREQGRRLRAQWQDRFAAWQRAHPELHELWLQFFGAAARLPGEAPPYSAGRPVPTRVAGGIALDAIMQANPNLVAGCADLTVPCFGRVPAAKVFDRDHPDGRYINFGVREHAMGSISNGIALHGGLRVCCATFLAFSDYMRPAIRMAALMKLPVTFVLTHDTVRIGADGPTHQPIEHLAALRAIPRLSVLRPADAEETWVAWEMALENVSGPTALVLTREDVPVVAKQDGDWKRTIRRGAYVVRDGGPAPRLVVAASGSDVATVCQAADKAGDSAIRVVSIICRELFLKQDCGFRESVLPPSVPLMVVEAGATQGWHRLFAPDAEVIGIDEFGLSGAGEAVYQRLGLGPDALADRIKQLASSPRGRQRTAAVAEGSRHESSLFR